MAAIPTSSAAVGRFAPSPSGRMHLGNLASALFAYAGVRQQGGTFLLRIEDLDRARCKPVFTDQIQQDLEWIGITWDGARVLHQSTRDAQYEAHLQKLAQCAQVYPCFCTRADLHAASAPHASDGQPIYAGTCRGLSAETVLARRAARTPAQRIAVPDETIAFHDLVYGSCAQNLQAECGDFVLKRTDGLFAYQLAVVVDDALSGVTQVVRGSDLLSSTARQIWLYRSLGYNVPQFAHIPLLCAPDGRRLSKREKDLDLGYLREHITPQRLLGVLAHWYGLQPAPQPCAIEEFIAMFSWAAMGADPIVLTEERLAALE